MTSGVNVTGIGERECQWQPITGLEGEERNLSSATIRLRRSCRPTRRPPKVRADPVAQAWARHLASRLRLVARHNEAVNAASRLGRQSTGAYMNGYGDPEFLHVAQIISREAEYIVSDEIAVREAELDGGG